MPIVLKPNHFWVKDTETNEYLPTNVVGEPDREIINEWLDNHPEATTTVQDGAISKPKLAIEVAKSGIVDDICILPNPITVDNLIDKNAAQIYAMFDEYVDKGIVTKKLIGYGTSSSSITDDAQPAELDDSGNIVSINDSDSTLPIYLYSYKSQANNVKGSTVYTILISGCLHGNEKTGIPCMLNILDCLEKGTDKHVNSIIGGYNIDFLPVVNPWGTNAAVGTTREAMIAADDDIAYYTNLIVQNIELIDEEKQKPVEEQDAQQIAEWEAEIKNWKEERFQYFQIKYAGRCNGRNVNLNRNGDYCWQSFSVGQWTVNYKGAVPASECETKILMDLLSDSKYYLYFETHGLMDNLMFQVISPSDTYKRIGACCVDSYAKRITDDYGIDFDAYHRKSDGTYRICTGSFGAAPFPANAWAHTKTSPHRAIIVEMQRYAGNVFHPASVQAYTSEFFITLIARIAAVANELMVSGEIARSQTANQRGNLLSMTSTDWANRGRNIDATWMLGNSARIAILEPIPVLGNEVYEFGVKSSGNNHYSNLEFIPSSAPGTHTMFNFKDGNRLFRPPEDGHIFIIVSRDNKTSYVDHLNVGKSIVPYLRRIGGTATLNANLESTISNFEASKITFSNGLAFVKIYFTITPSTVISGIGRYRVGNISPAPITYITGFGVPQSDYKPVAYSWSNAGGFFIQVDSQYFVNGKYNATLCITYPISINEPDIMDINDTIYIEEPDESDE